MSFGGFGTGFGATNTQQQQPQPQSNIFGNFGQQAQQQQSTLFGNNNPQQNAGAANQQQPATGFGAFGQQQQQQPTGGLGLFGTNANTNPTQPNTTGGGFGQTGTTGTGFGSFGAFGNNTNANANTAAPTTTAGFGGFGAFGQPKPQTPGLGLFGQPTNQQQQQQQQQPQQQGGFSLAPPTNMQPAQTGFGLLGSQQQQQQPTNTNAPNALFPASTNIAPLKTSIFAPQQSTTQQPAPTTTTAAPPDEEFMRRMKAIADAWDPDSPDCRFQQYFYNAVEPADLSRYQRPPNARNDALWQKAVRENPDPSSMVPVPAIGFQDLQKRIKAQSDTAELHLNNLQSFSNRLSALTSTHITKTTPALALIQLRQRTLSAQLTLIVTHLHMLIPTVRSTAIKPEEEKLREVLEDIKAELGRPGGIGRVGGKMGVLWGLIGKIKGDREASAGNTGEDHIWEVVDEQGLQEITKILQNQQQGLNYLTNLLKTALRDIDIIGQNAHLTASVAEALNTPPSRSVSSASSVGPGGFGASLNASRFGR